MRSRSTPFWILVSLALLSWLSLAEVPRRPAAKRLKLPTVVKRDTRGTLFYATNQSLVTTPNPLPPFDAFYVNYVASLDPDISTRYADQWRFHESQIGYGNLSWRGEHLSPSALDRYSPQSQESQMREQFARQVFRMRVDRGVRDLLKTLRTPTMIKTTQDALDRVKSLPIRFSSDENSRSGELRVGYDVLNDSSKIEYVGSYIESGLYRGQFSDNIADWKAASLIVSTNWGSSLPRATISLPLSASTYQTSLSKSLSTQVVTSITTSQPLNDPTQARQYGWQISYWF